MTTSPMPPLTPTATRRATALVVAALGALMTAGCEQEALPQYGAEIVPLGEHPVLVFGIDGATWDVIDPLIEAGELPNLAALRARASWGVLESELPSNSPVVWSTIFTGKQPHQHGVRDWTRSQSIHRRVKTVWDVTSETGLVTHVHNVPSSWPPVPVRGHMLSGFPLSGSTIGSGTGELLDLAAGPEGAAAAASGGEGDRWSEEALANRRAIEAAAATLAPGEWSDWLDGSGPEDPDLEGRMRVCRLDEALVYLSPIYRSDPGLVLSYPPRWQDEVAARLGTSYVPEGPGWSQHAEQGVVAVLYEHLAQVAELQTRAALLGTEGEWDLLVYVSTLVDRTSHPYWPYAYPEVYPDLDPALVAAHGDAVARAYRETDAQLGRFLERIPGDAYVVIVSDHGFESDELGEKDEHEGIHHEDGIYLVAGPGIPAGEGPRTHIEDTGPTILHLFGLPVGADMLGEVFPPVAAAELGHPLRVVETYETGRSYEAEDGELPGPGSDEVVDTSTWDQLRDLGYVEGLSPEELEE